MFAKRKYLMITCYHNNAVEIRRGKTFNILHTFHIECLQIIMINELFNSNSTTNVETNIIFSFSTKTKKSRAFYQVEKT